MPFERREDAEEAARAVEARTGLTAKVKPVFMVRVTDPAGWFRDVYFRAEADDISAEDGHFGPYQASPPGGRKAR